MGVLFYKVAMIALGLLQLYTCFLVLLCPFFDILSLPQNGQVTFTIFDTMQI